MHQQRSGLLPVALAFSAAQTLGSWQMGQRVGSIKNIFTFVIFNGNYTEFTSSA